MRKVLGGALLSAALAAGAIPALAQKSADTLRITWRDAVPDVTPYYNQLRTGIVLGHPGQAYHLEFTHQHGHKVGRAPSTDNLLVLYLPQRLAYQAAIGAMVSAGFKPVPSTNPYWEQHGATFEDPDGYRVVLANKGWDR